MTTIRKRKKELPEDVRARMKSRQYAEKARLVFQRVDREAEQVREARKVYSEVLNQPFTT